MSSPSAQTSLYSLSVSIAHPYNNSNTRVRTKEVRVRLGDLHEAEMVVGWKKRLPDEERELLQDLGARFVAQLNGTRFASAGALCPSS